MGYLHNLQAYACNLFSFLFYYHIVDLSMFKTCNVTVVKSSWTLRAMFFGRHNPSNGKSEHTTACKLHTNAPCLNYGDDEETFEVLSVADMRFRGAFEISIGLQMTGYLAATCSHFFLWALSSVQLWVSISVYRVSSDQCRSGITTGQRPDNSKFSTKTRPREKSPLLWYG